MKNDHKTVTPATRFTHWTNSRIRPTSEVAVTPDEGNYSHSYVDWHFRGVMTPRTKRVRRHHQNSGPTHVRTNRHRGHCAASARTKTTRTNSAPQQVCQMNFHNRWPHYLFVESTDLSGDESGMSSRKGIPAANNPSISITIGNNKRLM